MLKAVQKVGMEKIYLNKIKAMYDKPTANILTNDEKLEAFPLIIGTKLGCPFCHLFNIVLKSQPEETDREKK